VEEEHPLDMEDSQDKYNNPLREIVVRGEEILEDELGGEANLEVEVAVHNTRKAIRDVTDYLEGRLDDVPEVVMKAATDAKKKLRFITPFLLISSMARMSKAAIVLQKIEREIFDPEQISAMSFDQKVDFYKTMSKAHTDEMEALRRFMAQNKDLIDSMGIDSDEERLTKALRALDPEKLLKLKMLLNEMENDRL